jgi:TonB family protein
MQGEIMTENWQQWTGSVVADDITLLDYLGGSDTSAVFSTTYSGQKAAVKLIAVGEAKLESRLERLQAAEKLSHPHLLKVFRSGPCQLDGKDLLFVVMELAEENLSQVLPDRPLTPAETREMTTSTLDALSYLHGQGFVHGHLKPANIMASGELLKLSSDGIYRNGEPSDEVSADEHRAPEAAQGMSPATDVWSLGVTLVEVMTQRVPAGFRKELDALPSPFREIAPRCLAGNPGQRATLAEIKECLKPVSTSRAASASAVQAANTPTARKSSLPAGPDKQSSRKPYIIVAVVAVAIGALVAIPRLTDRSPSSGETRSESSVEAEEPKSESVAAGKQPKTAPPSALTSSESDAESPKDTVRHYPSSATPAASKEPARASRVTSSGGAGDGVVRRVVPDVPRSAANTIQGTVRVKMKVQVDASGNVTQAEFVSRGPSQYFSRLAEKAARDWKFVPGESARVWNLQFDFRRSGASVLPAPANQ